MVLTLAVSQFAQPLLKSLSENGPMLVNPAVAAISADVQELQKHNLIVIVGDKVCLVKDAEEVSQD